jgi:hypothetical protein
MTSLVVCPTCARHVRRYEERCPFCSADVPEALRRSPERPLPVERLTRSALVAFAAVGIANAACGGTTIERTSSDDHGSSNTGGWAPLYGLPPLPGTGGFYYGAGGTGGLPPNLGGSGGMPAYGSPPFPGAGGFDYGTADAYGAAPWDASWPTQEAGATGSGGAPPHEDAGNARDADVPDAGDATSKDGGR